MITMVCIAYWRLSRVTDEAAIVRPTDMIVGECKQAMSQYLSCIRKAKGLNRDECRELAKTYLACRMDKNLMARDDFKNLGFQDPTENAASSKAANVNSTQSKPT